MKRQRCHLANFAWTLLAIFNLFALHLGYASAVEPRAKTAGLIFEDGNDWGKITWYKHDFPPYFILDGEYKDKGILDQIFPSIVKNLPEFQHGHFVSNNAGFFRRVQNGDDVCAYSLIKTDQREELLYFSTPYFFVLQNAIFIREEDKGKFSKYINAKGRISLSKLIQNNKINFGVKKSVAYGKNVDQIILQNLDRPNVIVRKGKDLTEGLLKMLSLKRIDYMLAYDESVGFLSQKLNLKTKFMYIPIAEMPENYLIRGHMACPKTIWGRAVIDKVNAVIKGKGLVEKTTNIYKKWLTDDAKKEYLQLIEVIK